jgi:hypothetical protein
VSEALLRKCMQLVQTFLGEDAKPDISITFRDGRAVNSTDPGDVFSDSFIQSSHITQIVVSGSYLDSKRVYRNASVTFHKTRSSPIQFTVKGDRSNALIFERDLTNELSVSKLWYSPFVISYYLWYLIGVILIGLIFTLVFIAVNINYITKCTFNLLWSKIFMPAMVLWPLSLILLEIAFQSMIFNLGGGARRQQVRTTILSFIIVTVFAGILISIFTDWIKGWLTGSHT